MSNIIRKVTKVAKKGLSSVAKATGIPGLFETSPVVEAFQREFAKKETPAAETSTEEQRRQAARLRSRRAGRRSLMYGSRLGGGGGDGDQPTLGSA